MYYMSPSCTFTVYTRLRVHDKNLYATEVSAQKVLLRTHYTQEKKTRFNSQQYNFLLK
jgi:hypothetical protein